MATARETPEVEQDRALWRRLEHAGKMIGPHLDFDAARKLGKAARNAAQACKGLRGVDEQSATYAVAQVIWDLLPRHSLSPEEVETCAYAFVTMKFYNIGSPVNDLAPFGAGVFGIKSGLYGKYLPDRKAVQPDPAPQIDGS